MMENNVTLVRIRRMDDDGRIMSSMEKNINDNNVKIHQASTPISIITDTQLHKVNADLAIMDCDATSPKVQNELFNPQGPYKTHRTRFQLMRLSAAVCGIEFCYAAESAFVGPILLSIGMPITYMSLVWCCSPLLGFFIVPLLGSMSDRCTCSLGRRRPFVLALSVGILSGLILVPHGKAIAEYLDPPDPPGNETLLTSNITINGTIPTTYDQGTDSLYLTSIILTSIGAIVLDFSSDASQPSCRAYMLDVTHRDEHSAGLSSFTIFAGLGGTLGYIIGGIDWGSLTGNDSFISGQVAFVYAAVMVIYLACMIVTVTSSKEETFQRIVNPNETFEHLNKVISQNTANSCVFSTDNGTTHQNDKKITNSDNAIDNKAFIPDEDANVELSNGSMENGGHKVSEIVLKVGLNPKHLDKHNSTKSMTTANNTLEIATNNNIEHDIGSVADAEINTEPNEEQSIKMYLKTIIKMPKSLVILCLTNLFCWMSLLSYALYFTSFVGQSVYGGDPTAPEGSEKLALFMEGVQMGSWGMALYSLSCSFYSLIIEKLVRRFGAKPVYVMSQLVCTVGMMIMAIVRHPVAVIALSPTPGVMYATLSTMPFILVDHYHVNDKFTNIESNPSKRQTRGLGTDIAVVSSMVFYAQLLISGSMGAIIEAVDSTIVPVIASSLFSLCGAISATQVMYLNL
ncbi:unnamed protein product [Owenia fusiformis]|uniref:Uncharacterized protein n=1 Tax=Owenia fusiformis TaxID=6347 RepID=A0A8S4Q746_OWEFU|nr:unnamed protein product [Owenia fusiformis]